RLGGSRVPDVGLDDFDRPVALTETPDPEPRVRPAGAPVQRASVKGQLLVCFVEPALKELHRQPRLVVRRPRPKVAVDKLFASLAPGQRLAVVRHDHEGGLALALDFTTNREAARRAIEAIEAGAAAATNASGTPALHLALDAAETARAESSVAALGRTAAALAR